MARLDEFMNLEGFSLFKCSSVLFFSWQCGGRGRVNVVFLLWSKQVTYTNDLRPRVHVLDFFALGSLKKSFVV